MGIDKTEQLLNKFDYTYRKENNKLIIKEDFALQIIIDFSDADTIKITDKLVGWNFLTGLIEMSVSKAIRYTFFSGMLATLLFVYLYLNLGDNGVNFTFFFLAFLFWVALWVPFYIIKAESVKKTLMRWNE